MRFIQLDIAKSPLSTSYPLTRSASHRCECSALGAAFDVRAFHDTVLENGSVPLGVLREHVRGWIERTIEHTDKND